MVLSPFLHSKFMVNTRFLVPVEGVCEEASDACGHGDRRRERGTTNIVPGARVAPGDLQSIDNAIKYAGGAAVGVPVHASDRNC